MMRPVVLGLFLACAVALSSSAVILDNGVPFMWTQTIQKAEDLTVENGVVTLDPWNFIHRQSFNRLLISATDPHMGSMGTTGTDSPVWGLPLQLGWLLSSGRLADPTGATSCGLQTGDPMCISTQSWWGCMNYFVSALPFLAAAKEGFFGSGVQVQLTAPDGVVDYCKNDDECTTSYPDAMAKWKKFFQDLKPTAESLVADNEKKDTILGLYWEAEMASMYASAVCNSRQGFYSSKEVAFANSWLNSAEYISAAYFQTNLDNSVKFITPLPGRVLMESDNTPIADLSDEENHTLSVFSWMDWVNKILGGTLVSSWKRAMCSVATRETGRQLMGQLLLDPKFATASFVTIIAEMSTTC